MYSYSIEVEEGENMQNHNKIRHKKYFKSDLDVEKSMIEEMDSGELGIFIKKQKHRFFRPI